MNKLRLAILVTILLTSAIALVSFLLPTPVTWDSTPLQFHIKLVIAMVIPSLHVLAALFFFLGLTGFKQAFRNAYRLIAIGVVCLGFSLLASPVVTFFDLWDQWPMQLGMVTIPYIVAVLVVFAGIRTFFRNLQFKSVWRSTWVNISFVAALVVLQ